MYGQRTMPTGERDYGEEIVTHGEGVYWLSTLCFNILHNINYIYVKSLSIPQLRSLSIALNTMDRNISHDSCLNCCLCLVWVENYAYQRKRLWRGDRNPWTGSLLTLYILFNILHTINYMWLMFLSMSQYRSLSIVIYTLHSINYIYLKSLSMS